MDSIPLYRRLATHYREAMTSGALAPGDRMPSLRDLMQRHSVSLSTALQVCRQLEADGYLEARPRSGYFVCQPDRGEGHALEEPKPGPPPDPARYVGMNARVSEFIARGRQWAVRVNFSSARSAPSLYPGEALKNAAVRALRQQPDLLVKVASHGGNALFRAVLAKRALASGMVLSPDEVLVTQGCIEALNLALRAVAAPGDIVAVESPTFYGLLQVLETLGMRALEIPTSPHTGLSLEAMQLAFDSYPEIKALVVVPHLQNPLGAIMPDEHKLFLVELCRQHGVALIEDDTYSALVDDGVPRRALKAWDRDGGVIHCASLHKVLAPGMRLGWMNAGRWQVRVEMLKYAQSRYNDELAQVAAAEVMSAGDYDRHLQRLRGKLREQRQRTATAIASYFPPGTRFSQPKGGLALWVELPGQISSQAVFECALDAGILIAPGLMFSNSNRYDHFVRLNCGMPYTPEVDQALRELGAILHRLVRDAQTRHSIADLPQP
jgi:DNA-binding transcriptional MocR family regulator